MYIAFRCDDPEAAKIKTSITRRDNIWSDDWVGLSLDALGTGQVAYHMMVNPSGVQLDMLQTNSGGEDESPDWVWDSAGRVDGTGYTVEIRLPLQSIRFKGGDAARMGVLFWRRVSRTGYSVSWPQLKPNEWVFQHHAPLVFDQLRGRPTREAIPSVVYSGSEERATPSAWAAYDGDASVGLSGKYGRDVDDHRRRHGEPRLQPGRERRVPGRGQPALPDLLLGEAAVLHGGRRHLHPGRRRRRRRQHDLRGAHAPHRRPDRRRQGHRIAGPHDVRRAHGRRSGGRAGSRGRRSARRPRQGVHHRPRPDDVLLARQLRRRHRVDDRAGAGLEHRGRRRPQPAASAARRCR